MTSWWSFNNIGVIGSSSKANAKPRRMKIQMTFKKLVKPSSPTPDHLREFKVSLVDQIQPPVYTSLNFYYSSKGDGGGRAVDRDGILNRLEKSLSDTLTVFYHFSGRYNDEDASVECNDLGVEYSVTEVGCQLETFLAGKVNPGSLGYLWNDPKFAITEPLAVVRVNVFESGGIAIGLHVAHNIADMHTMLKFVNAWATTSRTGALQIACPNFSSSSVLPPWKLPCTGMPDFGRLVVDRFIFSSATLANLRLILTGKEHPDRKRPPTRLEIVTALISEALAKVAWSKDGQSKPAMICHSVSFRGRTKLPLIGDKDMCGNLYLVGTARANGATTWEDLAGVAQESITAAIKVLDAAGDSEDLCEKFMESMKRFREEANSGEVIPMMFTSWCNFPLYGVDFGMGEPDLVGTLGTPWESVTFMDSKADDEGGIEAWITMKERDLLLFRKDPIILTYAT